MALPDLTKAHEAVLSLLGWLPPEVEADATLVSALLRIPEPEALRLLEELEAAGDLTTATGRLQ